ncbi:MAG: carboxypeptidase regulatory-like domain-containing protein, partial [Ktedonobacteraceae bacterium]
MPSIKRILLVIFSVAVLLSFIPSKTKAQTFRAQIAGIVTDPSGAVVPNVKVIATNVATNEAQSAETNSQGEYRILDLLPGQYKVQAEATGFETFLRGPITLQVADIVAVNIKLQLGAVSQQVQVTSAASLLETQAASLGQVITQRSIVGLPLNVRDPLALLGLSSNVVFGPNFGEGNGQSADQGRNFFESDFNVGGGRSGSQEILLDGAPDTTGDTNRGVIDPPVDSVQEFKVQTNSYSAEYGRTTGGVINIITKSGTNDFHGRLYDFERNSIFDANSFFSNRAGLKKSVFIRHQFGGDAGGPVIKNRFFFFGDYEGLRQGFPETQVSTVPTAQQRQGDFSQTFGKNGKLIQIYDPTSLATLPNGSRIRSVFSDNKIPSTEINPVALKVLALVPSPNTPGDPITHQNNFTYDTISTTTTNKFDVRLDGEFSEKLRGFGRVSHQWDARADPGPFPLPAGGGRVVKDKYDQDMMDFSYIVSSQTVAEFRFSFTRALASQLGLSNGFNVSSLGIASNFNDVSAPQFPGITVSDAFTAGTESVVQFQPRNSFAWQGNITHILGSHTLKLGTDIRVLDFNEGQQSPAAGQFNFSRLFT